MGKVRAIVKRKKEEKQFQQLREILYSPQKCRYTDAESKEALLKFYEELRKLKPSIGSKPRKFDYDFWFWRYIEIREQLINKEYDNVRHHCYKIFNLSWNTFDQYNCVTNMQTTPYKYLIEYRLLKATQLLKQTDLPIGTISSFVGFHQTSQFGKCFKKKMGCTPKQYRQSVL